MSPVLPACSGCRGDVHSGEEPAGIPVNTGLGERSASALDADPYPHGYAVRSAPARTASFAPRNEAEQPRIVARPDLHGAFKTVERRDPRRRPPGGRAAVTRRVLRAGRGATGDRLLTQGHQGRGGIGWLSPAE